MTLRRRRQLSQIIDDTLRLCGDFRNVGGNGRTWKWDEVRDVVNDVILELSRSTVVMKNVETIIIQDGVNVYDLPPDCIRPLRIAMNGLDGYVILPKTITQLDITRQTYTETGDPTEFYREFLDHDQIGFIPEPSEDGTGSSRDSQYGLIRRLIDADGVEITFDGAAPLRRLSGVPFVRHGTDNIIREVADQLGNITVWYVRSPKIMVRQDDLPDPAIPEFLHKDLKYGVAMELLKGTRDKTRRMKLQRFASKWMMATERMRYRSEQTGPATEVRPL